MPYKDPEKAKAKHKEWYQKNKEKVKAKRRRWYADNKDQRNAYFREYYAQNKDKYKTWHHEYYVQNKEKVIEKNHRWDRANPGRREAIIREWRKSNSERLDELHQVWYAANKGRILERQHSDRTQNPEKYKSRYRRSYLKHPDTYRRNRQIRRARERGVLTLPIRKEFWEEAKAAWNGRCAYCQQPYEKPEQDHFVPIARQGAHAEYNLVPACSSCNRAKADTDPFVFLHDLRRKQQSISSENTSRGNKIPP
jgi:HNH endonuclease